MLEENGETKRLPSRLSNRMMTRSPGQSLGEHEI
jgi:hypothetical protein